MKCPNCGSEAKGAFCQECGSPLKGAKCQACNAPLAPGAKFCTNCGAATSARRNTSKLPWYVVGAALAFVILVVVWPKLRGGDDDRAGRVPISQLQEGTGAPGGGPSPLSGTPREQADRLFNRIMTERESGDSAKAAGFLPMGIQAYEIAGELDADGRYHLSLLHQLNHDYTAARKNAEQILATAPDHLLGLAAAGAAARAAGDSASARKYYERFLAVYDAEIRTKKQEYEDHARMLPELRTEAQRFIQ